MRDVDLEYYEGLLREIGEIVATGLRRPSGVAQTERQPLAIENDQLRKTIQLHAGDAMSLSGELNEWRERALAAEEALALSSTNRETPTESGHCWCGLHVTCRHQCDRCMKRGAFAVTSTDGNAFR